MSKRTQRHRLLCARCGRRLTAGSSVYSRFTHNHYCVGNHLRGRKAKAA